MSFQSLHFDFILDSVLVPRNILLYQPPSLTHAGWGAEPQEIMKIFFSQRRKDCSNLTTLLLILFIFWTMFPLETPCINSVN